MAKDKTKLLDAEFELFLDGVILDVADHEFTPEKKAERRRKADACEFAFCDIYFPQIFTEDYNSMHRKIKSWIQGFWSASGARKIGKSAYTYVSKIVRPIARKIKPNGLSLKMVGILMRTDDAATERTAAIVRLITRNKLLCYDYDIHVQQDLKGHYIINGITFIAVSVRQLLRGLIEDEFGRMEIMIADDLFGRNTVNSENDNKHIYDFVTSEAWGQMEDDGLFIWLGNLISADSPLSMMIQNFPGKHYSLPAIIEKDGKEFTCWQESKTHTLEYWHNKRDNMPFDVWYGEYMDEPIQKGDVFNLDWIRTVNINNSKIVASISCIDPAHGQSPESCYKGIITMGITTNDELVVEDIYLRRESYIDVFNYLFQIKSRAKHLKAVLFENDFNQWGIAKPFYTLWQQQNDNMHLPIISFSVKELATEYYGTDKDHRIMNLVFPHQTGKILYSDKLFAIRNRPAGLTNDAKLFLAQYIKYGKSKDKLDGLDAMATAFIMLPRYKQTGTFKSTKKRSFTNNEDSFLSRTGKLTFRK